MPNKILWCTDTINPIQDKIKGKSGRGYHCTKISPGCAHCYAEGMNKRFGNGLPFDGRKAEFELIQSELEKPLRWKKPRRIFWQSMGDLFHADVPFEFIDKILTEIEICWWHTHIILTKRIDRAYDYYKAVSDCDDRTWPLKNLWIGVTAENQEQADKRIPILLQIPAAVRFVSVEPMLSPISLNKAAWGLSNFRPPVDIQARQFPYPAAALDWVICGAETSHGARYMNPEWPRSLLAQCRTAGVPFFMKKMSGKETIPNDLMAREFPNV